ncbi:MAG: universal stress protein [Bacteroidetes bacterium]|nr:universal stress protein [Bacteroidota bacterium]
MKNILFPTDFSENANHALKYALRISQDFKATLHIINAYQLPYNQAVPSTYKLLDALKESSNKELIEYVNNIKLNPDYKTLKIKHYAIPGNLVNVVTDIEKEIDIDLIILGTKGVSGLKEVLIGSNAEQIVYHANTSVFVIPENAPSFSFAKAILAADLKTIKDSSVFSTYLSMCKKYNTENQIVTIVNSKNQTQDTTKETLGLDHLFSHINHQFFTEESDNTLEGINRFVEKNNSSVLVVLSRKYPFIETIFHKSITDKLTCRSKLPIFVVKEK